MKNIYEPETIQNQSDSDESMEQILASIRKIMAPSPLEPVAQKKEEHVSPALDEPSSPGSKPTFSANDDVLVLTRKPSLMDKMKSEEKKDHTPSRDFSEKLTASPSRDIQNPAGSLEGLVKSALSPLVQAWLEKNLPHIVEKVVKEEMHKLFNLSR